mmetsp:Transcript_18591/g.25879  ORF Transcript_18591/g.25879 Transcript_18591/m.25879 type:complete len:422 (-) Transcript_18591:181-1446(-)
MEVIDVEQQKSSKLILSVALSTLILGLGLGATLVLNQKVGPRESDRFFDKADKFGTINLREDTKNQAQREENPATFFQQIFPPVTGTATDAPMTRDIKNFDFRVMSFNIRRDFKSDGVNQWMNRKPLVTQMLYREQPDILGMQELLPEQMMDMKKILPGFEAIGVGRDDGRDEGEFVPLFVRKDKFETLKSGFFWLSRTPDTPGTIYPGAGCTRVTTWALLRPVEADPLGVDVLALSTHLDHVSEAARDQGADVIRLNVRQILAQHASQTRGTVVIVVGDFNAEPQEAALSTFLQDPRTDKDTVLVDSRLAALEAPDKGREFGTFPSWDANISGKVIDYVLYSPVPLKCAKLTSFMKSDMMQSRRLSREAMECLKYNIRRGSPSKIIANTYRVSVDDKLRSSPTQISDHRPVVVDFRIARP